MDEDSCLLFNKMNFNLFLIIHFFFLFLITGRPNCPSGYDESEEECGSARKLLELPGGIFAALGCIAAAISACLIFCILGMVRKRKKSVETKTMTNGSAMTNGTLHKNDYKKEPLFFDAES
jgi:hypothetical protein